MAIQKIVHAELAVDDFDAALAFHTDVLGMAEVARADGRVFLACGLDNTHDLELSAGGTGVVHLALEVDSEEDIADYAKRLANMGVQSEARSNAEPEQLRSLRFTAPSGHVIDLVLNAHEPVYQHASIAFYGRGAGVAPRDFDHITLQAADVAALVGFLTEALDFKVSDLFQPAPGVVAAAWTRASDKHHDIAIIGSPETGKSLHHYAMLLDSFEHIKLAVDRLSHVGIALETGPGRHGVGGNLYAYFRAPGGNRCEFAAEMARANAAADGPTLYEDFPRAFSAWGALAPESFARSS